MDNGTSHFGVTLFAYISVVRSADALAGAVACRSQHPSARGVAPGSLGLSLLNVPDDEGKRIDKLRKDLVYLWRSRFRSDIRLSLTFLKSSTEPTTVIFSAHRFILVSRSSYFRAQLLTWGSASSSAPSEPLTVTLPSPPFTPASLHFTLGYIYTGTLEFSDRTYDLDTAFAILRSANYLSLPQLYAEMQARIVYEMLHGLYHAFIEFDVYQRVTNAKWGIGGCRCRHCARRVLCVLEFALSDDIADEFLEREARRALVDTWHPIVNG